MSTSHVDKGATICGRHGSLLTLRIEPTVGCGNCAKASGCGIALFARRQAHYMTLPAAGSLNVDAGETVTLAFPGAILGRLAALYYLFIPVLMLFGALAASSIHQSDGDFPAIIGCGVGFLIGCAILKLYDSRSGSYWLGLLEIHRLSVQDSDS